MIELGKTQELEIVRTKEFGVYLSEKAGDEAAVLLPKKQVPAGAKIGDKVKVFIYKDSSDRLIATTQEPKITLDELAVLKVADTGRIGAFLDWGLEKDLFLPYKEMVRKVSAGDEILVTLYIDKSQRLCATTKGIYHMLSTDSPYKKDDMVSGRVGAGADKYLVDLCSFQFADIADLVYLGRTCHNRYKILCLVFHYLAVVSVCISCQALLVII